MFELLCAVLLGPGHRRGREQGHAPLVSVAGTPQAMLDLGLERLEGLHQTIGLYPTKARNLLATCRILVEQHGGQVPLPRGP